MKHKHTSLQTLILRLFINYNLIRVFYAYKLYSLANFYQAYYNKAIAKNFLGNYLEAINNYLVAIKINNKYFQAYNNLGSILIKINQTDDAINRTTAHQSWESGGRETDQTTCPSLPG